MTWPRIVRHPDGSMTIHWPDGLMWTVPAPTPGAKLGSTHDAIDEDPKPERKDT